MRFSGKSSSDQSADAVRNSRNANQSTEHVNVPLRYVFPWLASAAAQNAAWLDDFGDDVIRLPSDLLDVIEAYQHFHQ